jgi:hypothetical protein
MNKLAIGFWLAVCVIAMQPVWSLPAAAACGPNQVYSASMGRCIPKALMCNNNQVYSSSLHRCMPKPPHSVFIRHGCPDNLDKRCTKLRNGRLINCHCVS